MKGPCAAHVAQASCAALLALAVVACTTPPTPPPPRDPPPTKGFPPPVPEVRDSVYLPIERRTAPPPGYGMYTVLLVRVADNKSALVLAEVFSTTGSAADAAMARENLNLIMLPVNNATAATRALASARNQPGVTASELLQRYYDFGQASSLIASVCHPSRGAEVMRVCGSSAADGPLLVTTQRPLDGAMATPAPQLLVVNLAKTSPAAVREALAAYRRQILRKDFPDRVEVDGWRLQALNHILDAAQLLPGLSKAYAGGK